MKRSELVEKLADMLEFQRQDLDNGSDHQDADNILWFLEHEIGMSPPSVCRVNGKWDDEKYIAHFYANKNDRYWEDE